MKTNLLELNMQCVQRYCAVVAATVSLLAGSGIITPTRAAAQASAAPTFGSVNVDQVLNESKARQRDVAEYNSLYGSLRDVTNRLVQSSAMLLSSAELKELAGLYEKTQPTDADKKRIAALEKSADDRKKELATLENTPQPTDEQKRRLSDLSGTRQQGEQNMQQLTNDFKARLDKREEDLTTKTLTQIKDAIAAVAKSKNLAVVFDGKVAIYTANDITTDVIKQINK